MALMSSVRSFCRYGLSLLSLFCVLQLQSVTGTELKLVILVVRHGDTAPPGTYPKDPIGEGMLHHGPGQLSKLGLQQQYNLGTFLRKRYRTLLSPEYKSSEIYVQSADSEWAITSAEATMAGLYSIPSVPPWKKEINWTPVPVHTVPHKYDKLLTFPIRNCKRFQTLIKETMESRIFQDKVKSTKNFFSNLGQHTGYDAKSFVDLNSNNLYNLYDVLLFQSVHGHKLPKWILPGMMDQIGKELMYGFKATFGMHKQEEKSRLQGGVLVKEILEKITQATQSTSKEKLIMYTAYDTTIVALMTAFDLFEDYRPLHSSTFFFELYQKNYGDYTVEMFYKHKPDNEPKVITLPGCTAVCPLKKFKELVAPIIPNNWEKECNQ